MAFHPLMKQKMESVQIHGFCFLVDNAEAGTLSIVYRMNGCMHYLTDVSQAEGPDSLDSSVGV